MDAWKGGIQLPIMIDMHGKTPHTLKTKYDSLLSCCKRWDAVHFRIDCEALEIKIFVNMVHVALGTVKFRCMYVERMGLAACASTMHSNETFVTYMLVLKELSIASGPNYIYFLPLRVHTSPFCYHDGDTNKHPCGRKLT